jgi:hypothetical protein
MPHAIIFMKLFLQFLKIYIILLYLINFKNQVINLVTGLIN